MFVVTADQRNSRRGPDLVPGILEQLRAVDVVRPFERSIGDEIQGVPASASEVLTACSILGHSGQWSIGVGVGSVDEPLPKSTREGRGEAFIFAREAVEAAKKSYPSLAVRGRRGAENVEPILRLLCGVWQRRSPQGIEAIKAVRDAGGSQSAAAKSLGLSEQAISQRLRVASWQTEEEVWPVLVRLLDELNDLSEEKS